MLKIEKIDLSVLHQRIVKSAQLNGRSLRDETLNQGGLLQNEIIAKLPPRSLARAKKIGAADVHKVFSPFAANPNIEVGHRGNGSFYWFIATPKVLIGASRSDVQPTASVSIMAAQYTRKEAVKRKGKFINFGRRGKQMAVVIDRVLVKKSRIAEFKKIVADKFGKMKASFAHSWTLLNRNRPQPAKWIMKHVESGKARGAVIVNLVGDKTSVTLISRATGCEGEAALRGIRAAVKKRSGAIAADIRNQLRGDYKKAGFKLA